MQQIPNQQLKQLKKTTMAAEVGALAAAGIAALSTGGQIYAQGKMNKKTREWNDKMYGLQRQDALDDWNRTNQYNSPTEQMARFKAAGLNPNLIYGQQNDAPAVRSTDSKSWNPETPNYAALGTVATEGLAAYQDYTLQSEQIKHMQAQRKNMELDTTLKTIQVMGNEIKTSINALDLSKARELYDTSIEKAKEDLRATTTSTDIKISTEVRNAALHAPNLAGALEKVANLSANTNNAKQQLQNLKNTDVLQKMEIAMRKLGLSYSDGVVLRMLAQFADGQSLPELVKNLWSQIQKMGGPIMDEVNKTKDEIKNVPSY